MRGREGGERCGGLGEVTVGCVEDAVVIDDSYVDMGIGGPGPDGLTAQQVRGEGGEGGVGAEGSAGDAWRKHPPEGYHGLLDSCEGSSSALCLNGGGSEGPQYPIRIEPALRHSREG